MTSTLKVSEIQDPTNSNTALTIDSSGNITTSGFVNQNKVYLCSAAWDGSSTSSYFSGYDMFTAYETADHNFASGAKKIQYNNDYNILATSTGIVTIPADGVWLLTGDYTSTSGTVQRNIGNLWINDVYWGEWCEAYGSYDDVSTTRILKLSQNDTLKFGRNPGLPFDEFGFELARLG